VVTAADYARAEKFLAASTNPLIVGGTVNATWLPDDRFTYRSNKGDGQAEFLLVDPVAKTRVPAFDHARLAASLATASGTKVDPAKLPFQTIELAADAQSVSFDVGAKRYTCDVKGAACTAADTTRDLNAVVSPDGTRAVFIKDWNLWVRDLASKVERPLTTDGVTHFGYATDNAGWRQSARPVVLWSPDSKKVATFQQDRHATATCIWSRRPPGIRCSGPGSIRCRVTSRLPCCTAWSWTPTPASSCASGWRPTITAP
jgi:hypothetical protein